MVIYCIICNLITFVMYGVDKRKSELGQWRISENTLLACAGVGGSLGALLSMFVFHHKTQKPKFRLGISVIILIQAICLIVINNI